MFDKNKILDYFLFVFDLIWKHLNPADVNLERSRNVKNIRKTM